MLDPNQNIPITLNAMQWNAVLAQLDEGQHRTMRPLIDSIRGQCMMHDPQQQNVQSEFAKGQVVPFESAS